MTLKKSLIWPIVFIAICWAIESFEFIIGYNFHHLGVYPRHVSGLLGVLFHPFLHGGFKHLASNTFSLFFLSVILQYFFPLIGRRVLVNMYFLTGIGVWFFGREAFHIGASGVIYGMVSFLFFSGLFRKSPSALVISLSVALVYNGLLYGLVPNQVGVSWEAHLIGAIVGGIMAYYYKDFESLLFEKVKTKYLKDPQYEGVVPLENEEFRYSFKKMEN